MNLCKAHYDYTDLYVEIYFDEFPDDLVRESLKLCGWSFFNRKKCWSNRKTEENITFAKMICGEEKEAEKDDERPRYYFETDSFVLIRTNGFICNSKHSLEDIMGGFWVVSRLGNVRMIWVPLAFCEECSLYFMLKETYNELKKKGVILCQMMTTKQYETYGLYDDDFGKWRDIGPLKLWGYGVSKEEGLTDAQRRAILEDIIDYEVMSKHMVLSYLDHFIRLNSGTKPDAVTKWKNDRDYIAQYKGKAKRVNFV